MKLTTVGVVPIDIATDFFGASRSAPAGGGVLLPGGHHRVLGMSPRSGLFFMMMRKFFGSTRLKRMMRHKRPQQVKLRYFGLEALCFTGGVVAEDALEKHFHVALLDGEGATVCTVRADGPSRRPEVPAGHGFSIPVPAFWLRSGDTPRRFRFKVVETGEVFPRQDGWGSTGDRSDVYSWRWWVG